MLCIRQKVMYNIRELLMESAYHNGRIKYETGI